MDHFKSKLSHQKMYWHQAGMWLMICRAILWSQITILAAEPPVGSLSKNYESVEADRQHSSPSVTVSLSANWCLSNQISRECKQRQTAVSLWNVHRRKRKLSCSIWGKRKTRKKRVRACVDVSLAVTQSGNFVNGLMSQPRNVCKYCWCVWVFKADYWSSGFYQSFIF